MRALDSRLLHRTTAARPLLAVDTALGIATTVAVLAHAGLLALIVARAFSGEPLHALWLDLGLLTIAFIMRGGCACAMEIAGRRAAWSVLSEPRIALVETRLRTQAVAVDGAASAEIAAVSVQGLGALEGYFARYLPQVVLACVVPLLVIAWVAFVDLEAALIMLLTLPLVPVFMWLIGRYTEQRTTERWHALRLLSSHFLDLVRGLPTLRAFGRSHDHFKAVGREFERNGRPVEVRGHDFKDKQLGHAIPYGVYDLATDEGWVSVGITSDTAQFAANTIVSWWEHLGKDRYPNAETLTITADSGGSNNPRTRLWRLELQCLADTTGLRIRVCHFPPGTSKWNKIEHRMFSFVSLNWRGKPLESLEIIVNLIAATKTNIGLKIYARLDDQTYERGIDVTDDQLAAVNITRHAFHGDWNYTVIPSHAQS